MKLEDNYSMEKGHYIGMTRKAYPRGGTGASVSMLLDGEDLLL
jgi:hypothetical protein